MSDGAATFGGHIAQQHAAQAVSLVDSTSSITVPFACGHPRAGGMSSGCLQLADQVCAMTCNSSIACVQSVPALMTASDFCMFIRPFVDTILHLRMLRPATERNRYIVVLKFRSASDAKAFAKDVEGKLFLNGLIKETCTVGFVMSSEMNKPKSASAVQELPRVPENSQDAHSTGGSSSSKFPRSAGEEKHQPEYHEVESNFPNTLLFPTPSLDLVNNKSSGLSRSAESSLSGLGEISTPSHDYSQGASDRPVDSSFALTCPVCLERLDADVSALVTTLCNHTMHAGCLAQWDLDTCPVCRHVCELTPEASSCMTCGHTRGLWMCVVCAYVGCGVYTNKHANQHFTETQHPFAVNLEECTFWTGDKIKAGVVWDYVSERFVDRLLVCDDGKVVEMSHRHGHQPDNMHGHNVSGCASEDAENDSLRDVDAESTTYCGTSFRRGRGKLSRAMCSGAVDNSDSEDSDDRGFQAAIYASRMDALVNEYRSRMERMELEHEIQIRDLEKEVDRISRELEDRQKEMQRANETATALRDEAKAYKKSFSKRLTDLEKEGRELKEKNGFLKSLNESLLRDKASWNDDIDRLADRLAAKEKECVEKEEQLRDVMLHLEAQAKVADASTNCRVNASSSSEASGGDILGIGPSPRERMAMRNRRRG